MHTELFLLGYCAVMDISKSVVSVFILLLQQTDIKDISRQNMS